MPVVALDDIGQQTIVDGSAIMVAAKPPLPPAAGPLTLTPGNVSFGSVRVGRTGLRFLLLHNAGPRKSAPVSGVLSVSGASFSLPRAAAAGVRFTLAAGQWRLVAVAFRPAKPGSATGRLSVTHSDHGQSGLRRRSPTPMAGRAM